PCAGIPEPRELARVAILVAGLGRDPHLRAWSGVLHAAIVGRIQWNEWLETRAAIGEREVDLMQGRHLELRLRPDFLGEFGRLDTGEQLDSLLDGNIGQQVAPE